MVKHLRYHTFITVKYDEVIFVGIVEIYVWDRSHYRRLFILETMSLVQSLNSSTLPLFFSATSQEIIQCNHFVTNTCLVLMQADHQNCFCCCSCLMSSQRHSLCICSVAGLHACVWQYMFVEMAATWPQCKNRFLGVWIGFCLTYTPKHRNIRQWQEGQYIRTYMCIFVDPDVTFSSTQTHSHYKTTIMRNNKYSITNTGMTERWSNK